MSTLRFRWTPKRFDHTAAGEWHGWIPGGGYRTEVRVYAEGAEYVAWHHGAGTTPLPRIGTRKTLREAKALAEDYMQGHLDAAPTEGTTA